MRIWLTALFVVMMAGVSRADLVVEKLEGDVTANEVTAFKEFMKTVEVRGDN